MQQKGLIVNIISNLFIVEVEGKIYECTSRGKFKKAKVLPIVGDIVDIEILSDNKGVINNVYERISYIKRPKIANISQLLFVVSAKNPKPDLLMLDKQLCFAEYINIKPIIIINKIDLNNHIADEISDLYTNIGYRVIKTNAKSNENIQNIKGLLDNNISAFAGNSGVGKSTIINSILNENVTQEGEISKKNKKGKNTTTNTKLYKLKENTYISDTPGFSNFDIYEIESKNLYKYFIEFEKHVDFCEYLDCNHIKEANCGIKEALKSGEINKDRYERFCKIYNELKEKEEHKW